MSLTVKTNHHERPVLRGHDLTLAEQQQFDYLDWDGDAAYEHSFFRYCGSLYDLGEFTRDFGITKGAGLPDSLSNWDGYMSESAFTAVVVRYAEDHEHVVVGWVLS